MELGVHSGNWNSISDTCMEPIPWAFGQIHMSAQEQRVITVDRPPPPQAITHFFKFLNFF